MSFQGSLITQFAIRVATPPPRTHTHTHTQTQTLIPLLQPRRIFREPEPNRVTNPKNPWRNALAQSTARPSRNTISA
jgi:hypothetical protein